MIGIYAIILPSKHFYIGSSVNIFRRWFWHISDLEENKHCNINLQRAYNKYSIENFTFVIIEECTRESLLDREQYYIDSLKPEYNICKIAGSSMGTHLSEEAKEKLRQINLGKHHSEEVKEKCRIAGMKKKGPFSEEHRRKLSESHKGKAPGNKGKKGKPHTEEWKKMMSERFKGKNNPYYGKKHSEEIKMKMRKYNKHVDGEVVINGN